MRLLTLAWAEALVSELTAPNGEVLLSIALPNQVRAVHREDGELAIFSRSTSSFEESKTSALDYAKAWLAGQTSVEEVYGSMQDALAEIERGSNVPE